MADAMRSCCLIGIWTLIFQLLQVIQKEFVAEKSLFTKALYGMEGRNAGGSTEPDGVIHWHDLFTSRCREFPHASRLFCA